MPWRGAPHGFVSVLGQRGVVTRDGRAHTRMCSACQAPLGACRVCGSAGPGVTASECRPLLFHPSGDEPTGCLPLPGEFGEDRLQIGTQKRFIVSVPRTDDGREPHRRRGPVGLEAIAATINDEAETLAEVVEPFLLKIGYIVRSPNGRRATTAAYAHLGCALPVSPGGQTQLPL